MSLTNAQVALQAAAAQIDPAKGPYTIPDPKGTGNMVQVAFDTATKQLAASYLTWLDQQDELARLLPSEAP